MGCGSSAAVSSASKVQSITLHTKDAGSQTNVTVLVSSATSDARTEAHDARKELIMQHRSQALAKARELSNSKSGYNTATYTGSGMSTPRSAYSRTLKFRPGSSLGSLSDCDLKSRSEILTVDMNNSRSNLSDRSSNVRKTRVSFRNEEYNRMATANVVKKRRRSYMNNAKRSNTIVPGSKKVHMAGSDHSASSGTNSINKQADTGYEGSVSSGPSMTTLVNGTKKSAVTPEYPSPSDISIESSTEVPITQTLSNETNPGRLSVVVSMDEQSLVHDTTNDDQKKGISPTGFADGFNNHLSLQETTIEEKQDLVQDQSCGETHQSQPVDNSGENGHISDHGSLETDSKGLSTLDNPILNSDENYENPGDDSLKNGPIPALPLPETIEEHSTESEPVNSNAIVVSKSHVLTKSDSVSSMKQVVNISSSNDVNSNGITAID